MRYLLLYEVVDRFVERRTPHRDAHLALVREASERGELLMAGAFSPADGAALLFEAADDGVPRRFAQADPYVREGLVTAWRVRRWDVVLDGTGHAGGVGAASP
jgi:uncharacterized protein